MNYDASKGEFTVSGLESGVSDAFCKLTPVEQARVFRVLPQFENQANLDAFAMLGQYRCESASIIFTPQFELRPDLTYLAIFELDHGDMRVSLKHRLRLERPKQIETNVLAVYPSGDQVPANLLKVYISFSASMSRSYARDHVRLLDENGRPIQGAFLELEDELWDSTRKRLTLLLDPGRIKRGLAPHLSHGPPLAPGMDITLVVDAGWPDGRGQGLASGWRKTYQVVAEDRQAPRPESWQWQKPEQGSRQPLVLRFPEPLDYGLLHSGLVVADQTGQALKGEIQSAQMEYEWRFTPTLPWQDATYELQVTDRLEDLAGNNLNKTFDRDLSHGPLSNQGQPKSRHFRFNPSQPKP